MSCAGIRDRGVAGADLRSASASPGVIHCEAIGHESLLVNGLFSDGLRDGWRLRALAIEDDFGRECLSPDVDTSITGKRVAAAPERLADLRGA
jgi:hypothetical protein